MISSYSRLEDDAHNREERLNDIYNYNIIRPSALYIFQDASVLCMPFAELGTYFHKS